MVGNKEVDLVSQYKEWFVGNQRIIKSRMESQRWEATANTRDERLLLLTDYKRRVLSEMGLCGTNHNLDDVAEHIGLGLMPIYEGYLEIGEDVSGKEGGDVLHHHAYLYHYSPAIIVDITFGQAILRGQILQPGERLNYVYEMAPENVVIGVGGVAMLVGTVSELREKLGMVYSSYES